MKIPATTFPLLLSAVAIGSSANQSANRVWITDVFIISPENLDQIGRGSVLIEDGRIASVERNQRAKRPPGAAQFSGNGQFLIPGLID